MAGATIRPPASPSLVKLLGTLDDDVARVDAAVVVADGVHAVPAVGKQPQDRRLVEPQPGRDANGGVVVRFAVVGKGDLLRLVLDHPTCPSRAGAGTGVEETASPGEGVPTFPHDGLAYVEQEVGGPAGVVRVEFLVVGDVEFVIRQRIVPHLLESRMWDAVGAGDRRRRLLRLFARRVLWPAS